MLLIFHFLGNSGIVTPPVAGYLVQYFGYQKASSGMFLLLAAWVRSSFKRQYGILKLR